MPRWPRPRPPRIRHLPRKSGGGAIPAAVTPTPSAAGAPAATLVALRDAVGASHRAAAQLVVDLPAHRVGLVASVAACCATYASVLA